jgi:hypothetical protein
MNLSETEIVALTARERHAWQARQLDHLGIPYRRRTDGSLVVLRVHVESVQHQAPKREPRLRAV